MVNLAHLIQRASSLPSDTSALERAISALEREITALESSSVPWERRLPWFTAVVALGVAMELWIIWHDRREEMHAWGRGVICWPPHRPSFRKYILEIVSILLVTGGIVAELWAGVRITQINGSLRTKSSELRSKSDQLLALVTQEAGTAQTSAEGAADAAVRANAKAGDAGNLAVRVNNEAGILAIRTETLQAQGESLQKLINSGKEDLAVLKMPRSIGNTQDWFPSLHAYKGTEYAFTEVFPDAESIRLLVFIDSLLKYAGWKRVPAPQPEGINAPIAINPFGDCRTCFVTMSVNDGVAVEVEEPNPPSELAMIPQPAPEYIRAAAALHSTLFAGIFPRDGAAASAHLIAVKGTSHVVFITVGSKPEPTEPYDPKEWKKIMEKIRQQQSQTAKP